MRSGSRKLIAVRTPRNFASSLAEATQPRPTSTGLPRSLGFSTCSTEAKNASTSTCTILGMRALFVRAQQAAPLQERVLSSRVRQSPSQDQADHGFFSAAGFVCGASGFGNGSKDPPLQLPLVPPDSDESAGLKPRATVSCSASVS